MNVIGITGSFGSGKTVVANIFRQKKIKVLDADKIVHDLMRSGKSCFKPIVNCFGEGILKKGQIDRHVLGNLVFRNKKYLNQLCAIIHPKVISEIKKEIKDLKTSKRVKNVVMDVPLLFESGLESLCDTVIVVKATQAKQIDRIQKKFGLDKAEILRRIRLQMPIQKKIQKADYIVENTKTFNQTKKQVEDLCQKVLNK
ncbi:MAG: dephospho-CoA kinase [Candidatus Omnitrophica bacterium]|nr:dephospho-CoA kinase [Candidatus Omnitrophota bacterium]